MICILRHVTRKNEEYGKEEVVTAVKDIEEDIKQLLRCVITNYGLSTMLMIL